MPAVFLCAGADIKEPAKLRIHCNPTVHGWRKTSHYKRNEYKYIDREGNASPNSRPLPVPMYPKDPADREESEKVKIKYARTYHDQPPKEAESETECFPELGRFSAMAIPPEKPAAPEYSRWNQ
jgi:hypothetical protein